MSGNSRNDANEVGAGGAGGGGGDQMRRGRVVLRLRVGRDAAAQAPAVAVAHGTSN